jgi:hypothetical protein
MVPVSRFLPDACDIGARRSADILAAGAQEGEKNP